MSKIAPLVVVAGSTGVGKSRLSVELASSIRDRKLLFNTHWTSSKIINADAMQTYKGLDLVTNKITQEEMNGIEHTLFDFRDLKDDYIVTDWVMDAISEIDGAHETQKLPIVVGGTTYWLQHLIFANGLTSLAEDTPTGPSPSYTNIKPRPALSPPLQQLFDQLPGRADNVDEDTAFELHTLLTHLDPATAARWHWKDARKVLGSLHIIRESNNTVGEVYGSQTDPVPRYRTLVFWLYMDPSVLNSALDSRVDKMVKSGLRDEIEQMRQATDGKIEMIGLNQAIGYKEFDTYFSDPCRPQVEFNRGVERMKVATRQYAARQVKWLKARLLPIIIASPNVQIVMLEIKDPADWNKDVLQPALRDLTNFLAETPTTESETSGLLRSFVRKVENPHAATKRRKVRCDVCTVDPRKPVMLDEKMEWDAHRKSRSHRRREMHDSRKQDQLSQQEAVQAKRAAARASFLFDSQG